MIVEALLKLPGWLYITTKDGVGLDAEYAFELKVFVNGPDEARIGYELVSHDGWYNKFSGSKNHYCDHLILVENISNDEELKDGINEIFHFLIDKMLI